MSAFLGSLRRLLLAPSLASVTFERRGFPGATSASAPHLEAIPQAVICGFEWAIEAGDQWEVERRLELVVDEHRGFAYEGAVMACAVRDAMGRGRAGRRTRALMLGPARRHVFLAYIGIGFAMARLPRPLWRSVLPDLDGLAYHPTMSWLAVDGYGFDRAYFDTRRWVDDQRVADSYPWQGDRDYFPRAADQGVGRALWFIHGARPDAVAAAVGRFADHRRSDLRSGVGLAATFAGGADPAGLASLRALSGEHCPHLGQGAVFAAKARDFSGVVPGHVPVALTGLTGLTVPAAVALADLTEVRPGPGATMPSYELWRAGVRDRLPSR